MMMKILIMTTLSVFIFSIGSLNIVQAGADFSADRPSCQGLYPQECKNASPHCKWVPTGTKKKSKMECKDKDWKPTTPKKMDTNDMMWMMN
jgi:hypothetical protein